MIERSQEGKIMSRVVESWLEDSVRECEEPSSINTLGTHSLRWKLYGAGSPKAFIL